MPQPYTIVSNPVAVLTYVEEAGRDLVMVFGMSQNGQVHAMHGVVRVVTLLPCSVPCHM